LIVLLVVLIGAVVCYVLMIQGAEAIAAAAAAKSQRLKPKRQKKHELCGNRWNDSG